MFGNCSSFRAVTLSPMRTAESFVVAWRLTQNSAVQGGEMADALTCRMSSMPSKLNARQTFPLAKERPLSGVPGFEPAESAPLSSPRHQLMRPGGAGAHGIGV